MSRPAACLSSRRRGDVVPVAAAYGRQVPDAISTADPTDGSQHEVLLRAQLRGTGTGLHAAPVQVAFRHDRKDCSGDMMITVSHHISIVVVVISHKLAMDGWIICRSYCWLELEKPM